MQQPVDLVLERPVTETPTAAILLTLDQLEKIENYLDEAVDYWDDLMDVSDLEDIRNRVTSAVSVCFDSATVSQMSSEEIKHRTERAHEERVQRAADRARIWEEQGAVL